jgi:cbb3-type cytochrome oxidase cytochrome c subunit
MKKDLLQTVIKVEKEIQQTIEAEKKKAAAWLESERISASQDLEKKKQRLHDDFDQSLEQTCRLTKNKAESDTAEVDLFVAYLENISDEILRETVAGYLKSILPEGADTEQ